VGHFDARRPQVVRLRQALTTHCADIAGEAQSMRIGTAAFAELDFTSQRRTRSISAMEL
jgi:hypothetical protein